MFDWEYLISHRHWITLHIFSRELHLCARCTGVILGFSFLKIILALVASNISIPFTEGLFISLLLSTPTIIDWTTQSIGFRQSTNNLRLLTGLLEGIGFKIFSLSELQTLTKQFVLFSIAVGIIGIGLFGRRLIQK